MLLPLTCTDWLYVVLLCFTCLLPQTSDVLFYVRVCVGESVCHVCCCYLIQMFCRVGLCPLGATCHLHLPCILCLLPHAMCLVCSCEALPFLSQACDVVVCVCVGVMCAAAL